MVSGMFSAAKVLASAGLRSSSEGVAPPHVVFMRIYRTDFDPDELGAIAEHIKATWTGSTESRRAR